jgi:chorismate synthase
MNTFGRLLRTSIFGESHGPEVGVLIDGCPAGLPLAAADFLSDLDRRKAGKPGTTARREDDIPMIMSGVFNGRTTGAPIMIVFANKDTDSRAYEETKTRPRPGHADLTAAQKYGGFNDYRGGGMFSGRLTTGLVAAGVVAKKLIPAITIHAKLLEAGGSVDIDNIVRRAAEQGDSVGGLVECTARNVPAGLGEPFFDSVESLLAHLVFSIPGIKGIEFGAGFACARMSGSAYNDPIISPNGQTATNNAGGINGGIANGNDLVFRVAVRPTASIAQVQSTIDMQTGEPAEIRVQGRHDACIALRVPVIVEAACALVIADLMMIEQKTGTIFTPPI